MFRCSIQRSIISSFWLLLCLITADIIHLWDFRQYGTFEHVSAFYEKRKPASEDRNGASCGFSGNSVCRTCVERIYLCIKPLELRFGFSGGADFC